MTQQNPARVRIPFVEHLGIRLAEQSSKHAVITLDKRPGLLASLGTGHGHVLMTMLDYVMSTAVRGCYGADYSVVTADLSLGFMSAATGGQMIAQGRILHRGAYTAFCEAEAHDHTGKLLAKAIGTFNLVPEKKFPKVESTEPSAMA